MVLIRIIFHNSNLVGFPLLLYPMGGLLCGPSQHRAVIFFIRHRVNRLNQKFRENQSERCIVAESFKCKRQYWHPCNREVFGGATILFYEHLSTYTHT